MNKGSGNIEGVHQTEAQWTADERVFAADVMAITTDGADIGKHKLMDGIHRWTALSYVEDGGALGTISAYLLLSSTASAFTTNWAGSTTAIYRDTGNLNSGKPVYMGIGLADDVDTDGILWNGTTWTVNVGGNPGWTSTEDVSDPTLVTTWVEQNGTFLPLPTTSDLYTGTIQEAVEALATRQGPREAVWEGYISQVGIAAPTVVTLTNTLGGTPVLTYDAPGNYDATLAGAFGALKTSWWFGPANNTEPESGGFFLKMTSNADDILEIDVVKDADVGADDALTNTYFKITVKR